MCAFKGKHVCHKEGSTALVDEKVPDVDNLPAGVKAGDPCCRKCYNRCLCENKVCAFKAANHEYHKKKSKEEEPLASAKVPDVDNLPAGVKADFVCHFKRTGECKGDGKGSFHIPKNANVVSKNDWDS